MNCRLASRHLLASAAMLVATPVFAQDTAQSPANDDPEPIVVVGALTDVAIDRAEIELTQANDLNDLFRNVPSVAVGGSLGIAQKIYVRGLEDSLLNVTIDGAPQRGTLFHHIGRVTIEPELLESVEVQAGAGEATSGFGAVGGSIRFRTVDPVNLLRSGRNYGAIAKAGWFSNDGYKLSATAYARLFGDVGEEDVGIWRFDFDPAGSPDPVSVAKVDRQRITDDVEGLTIMRDGAHSYLIASSQGDDTYAVFRIEPAGETYVGRFAITESGGIDGITSTDGIDAWSGPIGDYPEGLIAVHDDMDQPTRGQQNFKLMDWRDIKRAVHLP